MISPFDADVDSLISQGWGSHSRHLIPKDWQTRCGPDQIWGQQQKARGSYPKRMTYAERQATNKAIRMKAYQTA